MKKQEILNLSYMAGLFDGEGSIFIGKIKTPRNKSGYLFRLNIEVGNTNELVMRWVHSCFGGSLYERYANDSKKRTLWAWHLRSRKAITFLKTILPYLKVKRLQAELAIKFQERQLLGRYKRTHTDVLDEADSILMSNLNRGRANAI